ncbi:MAG TPA: prolyl aminopeptidase, partial [Colwellia sp.]|nr:prolyl aminopeptidase [Colwellia sp.]
QATTKAAYSMLVGEDKKLAQKIATAWSIWEIRCCTLKPDPAFVNAATG